MNLGATLFWYCTTIIGTAESQFELSYPGTRFRVSFTICVIPRDPIKTDFQAFRAEPKSPQITAEFTPDQLSFDWLWKTESSLPSNNILQDISWLKRCEITKFQNYFAICQYK